jgi:hypothetical protein
MLSRRGSGTHHKYRSKEPLPLAATRREGAIQNDAGPLLITAGAGTAKTEALVAGCLKSPCRPSLREIDSTRQLPLHDWKCSPVPWEAQTLMRVVCSILFMKDLVVENDTEK